MGVQDYIRNATRFSETVRRRPTTHQRSALPVPAFVINLARAEHRRRYIVAHLRSLGIQPRLFPAVDGRTLDLEELEREGIYRDQVARDTFSHSLSPAMIGCSLSHVHIYKTMIDEGIPVALVVEDDALFVPDFIERVRVLLRDVPEDWGILQLLFGCKDYERIGQGLVRFTMKPTMPVGSTAYLITRSGAEKMYANAHPIRYPPDSYIGRSHRWGVTVYGAQPHLVEVNNVFPSDILPPSGLKARVGRTVRQVVLRVLD